MRTRAGRFALLGVLLVAGIGAAYASWSIAYRIAELERAERDTADQIDRLQTTVESVRSAQQTFASTPPDGLTPRKSAQDISTQLAALRAHVRSGDGGRLFQTVIDRIATLRQTEERAHEHLRLGQELMAEDLILSEGRPSIDAIGGGIRELRAAEITALASARAVALSNAWVIIGAVSAAWALGLIVLVRVPAAPPIAEPSTQSAASLLQSTDHIVSNDHDRGSRSLGPDLASAADLCTSISRLGTADDLPELLKRAAAILDASGIVVWMAAGEELFATTTFGYQAGVLRRMGPIHRSAINATAAAWRTGTVQIVTGDVQDRGAVVAPLLAPDRCIGVLALELLHGRENDPVTKAVATMLAAQLAAVVVGWPEASAAAPVGMPPLDTAAEA